MLRRQLLTVLPFVPLVTTTHADDDRRHPDETLTIQQIDAWTQQIASTINAPSPQAVAASLALAQLASNLKARLGVRR